MEMHISPKWYSGLGTCKIHLNHAHGALSCKDSEKPWFYNEIN
jgi:hypothetical protein